MGKYRKKPVIIEAYHIKDLSYESVKDCLEKWGVNLKGGIGDGQGKT